MRVLGGALRRVTAAAGVLVLAAGSAVASVASASADPDITWESAPASHTFSSSPVELSYFTSVKGGAAVMTVNHITDEAGRPMLCTDFSRPSPTGQVLNPTRKAGANLAYLANLLSGVAHNDALNGLDGDQTYYVLQYVAHMYDSSQFASFTDASGGPINDPLGLIPRIQQIKAAADAAQDQDFRDVHAITVSPAQVASSITADGTWLSDPVTVHLESAGATVSTNVVVGEDGVRTGSTVVDATTGDPVSQVADGQQVRIATPDASAKGAAWQVSANIAASWEGGHERIGYLYGDPSTGVQIIVGFDELTFNDAASTSFTTTIPQVVGSVSGTKIGPDNKALTGVEFSLSDADGNPVTDTNGQQIAPLVTGEDGSFEFTSVPWGTWYVTETATLPGYVKAEGRHEVVIDGNHTTIQVGEITNSLQAGTVRVHKVDQSSAALSGAEFTLTDETGAATSVTTGADGIADFPITALHTYRLVESKTPDGYTGGFSKDNITLDHDGQVIEFTATNTKQDNGAGAAGQGLAAIDTGKPGSGPDLRLMAGAAGVALVISVGLVVAARRRLATV